VVRQIQNIMVWFIHKKKYLGFSMGLWVLKLTDRYFFLKFIRISYLNLR